MEEERKKMEALKGLVDVGVYEDMEEAIRESEIVEERKLRRAMKY